MATADVTVMGAGVFGLSVAYACARRGAFVRVVDPNGVASGASGGVVGALAPHVPENWNEKKAFQFDSLIMAAEFWAGVEVLTGTDVGYARTGRLQPLLDDRAVDLAHARALTASELWEGKAVWEVMPAGDETWMPPSPTGLVIRDSLSALIHPRRATRALANAVLALGGQVVSKAAPEGQIVWATGWQGLTDLSGQGVKGQAALLQYDAAGQPQLFADALHIIPHGDGTVAVGSTSERAFDDPFGADALLDDVLARARSAFPILQDAPVIERWAGIRPRSRSRAPVLGRHPTVPDAFIANGGFKIGFGMAPKAGELMADLMLDGRDRIPPAFHP